MSNISPDIINRLNGIQAQIWQTVSNTVAEACGQMVTFQSPLTIGAKTADMYSEFSSPMMVLQFAFAGLPENPQVFLIPQDTIEALAPLILNEEVGTIDENTVADMRATLEGIVQGICLSIGNVRNETIVASGLTIRHQIFSFPPNLQRSEELARVQVAISLDEVSGTGTWLMDMETVACILGLENDAQAEPAPFVDASGFPPQASENRAQSEDHSLELLMDIPLEITVELGRVKMLVKDVVELGTGSIVEIDKLAGEPVDVMVNGRAVARGEVVVIEDNFGVRITEIVNPHERIARLGEVA